MNIQKACIEHLLYPYMERCRDNRIRPLLRQLQQTQYEGKSRDIQRKRLTQLLLHCRQHVPAYGHLPAPEQLAADPYEVLRQFITPLSKAEFQLHPQDFLADNCPREALIENCTGGSTGQPVHFFMTRAQVEAYEAARWRGLSWYGITPGSRSVMLWGSPIELSQQQQRRRRWSERLLKNRQMLSAYDLTPQAARQHLALLSRYRPEYLYGYATILTAFAQLLEQQGREKLPPLKALVSTSETLEAWQVQLFERVFRCPVANEYGARDAGILAYSCPQGGLHIAEENCLIEVVDPITLQPVPTGQSGALSITDLGARAQPRLRWLVGDMGAVTDAPCGCGRTLPCLTHIDGRVDDLLIGPGGALVHGNVVGQLLRPLDGLRAFQFRQQSPTTALLLLVKATAQTQLDEGHIHALLSRALPNVAVTLKYVPAIAPSPSGKTRYAIREFPLSQ